MAQGNPNPINKFKLGNEFGKLRKRRVASEKLLREALFRKGKEALTFLEDVFTDVKEETKYRIQAAAAWTKLVFIQPKEETGESITDVKLTAKQHEEFDRFLVEIGVPIEKIGDQKQMIIKSSEFLKKLADQNKLQSEDEEDIV